MGAPHLQFDQLEALGALVSWLGLELEPLMLAVARVFPALVLLPIFAARLMPVPARAALSAAIAIVVLPGIQPGPARGASLPLELAYQALIGLPPALSAAAFLWAAGMTGAVIDDVRGQSQVQSRVLEQSTPLGTLTGLFAAVGFMQLGGVERLAQALLDAEQSLQRPFLGAAHNIVAGVDVALALAAPVLALVVVVDVAGGLVAKAASPAHIQQLWTPVRAFILLGALSLLLNTVLSLLTEVLAGGI